MSTETNNDKYYDLDQDTIDLINKVMESITMPFNIKVKMIGSSKMKCLIKLQKVADVFAHMTGYDLIIYINEDYLIRLDDINSEILIYQDLDRLQFDIEKGTFKLGKFQLQTNPGVLKKFGIDAVANANQLTDLLTQQKADSGDDQFDINTSVKSVKKSVDFLN
jgi:hypothetical protein